MATVTIDRSSFDKLAQLLHEVNNHATVVCGYLQDDEKLKPHISAIIDLLNKSSNIFSMFKENDDIKNREKPP